MRREICWVRMAWRLLIALILALCLVPIEFSPVAALSVEDLFQITYDISLSKTAVNGNEIFYAIVQGEARCEEDLEFPYNLVNEAQITGCVIATNQTSGTKVTLNSSYTVTIDPFPTKKDEITQSSVVVSLQFPREGQSGLYSVAGELIEAKVNTLIGWHTVTFYLPSSQAMGSVTYIAPDGSASDFDPALTPISEEVKANLFGTEVSSLISRSGEVLETIEATSEDGALTLTIAEGTIALDKDDNSLTSLEADIDDSPPPHKDASIIGLAYNFGPDGATFAPSIALTWSYGPNDIPEGVVEEDLVLAWYDVIGEKWVELNCVVDTRNNTITATIEHFTTFAIIGVVTAVSESELGTPTAIFHISELNIYPGEVDIGNEITITALVTNIGNLKGICRVALGVGDNVFEIQEVSLADGDSDTVTFKVSEDVAGIYSVNVNGLSGSFAVRVAATTESTPAPTSSPPKAKPINWPVAYGVAAALVTIGVLLFFWVRWRHTKFSS